MMCDLGNLLYVTTGIGLHRDLGEIADLASYAANRTIDIADLPLIGAALREVLVVLHHELPDFHEFLAVADGDPVAAYDIWVSRLGSSVVMAADVYGSILHDPDQATYRARWESASSAAILKAAARGARRQRRVIALLH